MQLGGSGLVAVKYQTVCSSFSEAKAICIVERLLFNVFTKSVPLLAGELMCMYGSKVEDAHSLVCFASD